MPLTTPLSTTGAARKRSGLHERNAHSLEPIPSSSGVLKVRDRSASRPTDAAMVASPPSSASSSMATSASRNVAVRSTTNRSSAG